MARPVHKAREAEEPAPPAAAPPDALASPHGLAAADTRMPPLASFLVWALLAIIGWGLVALVIHFL